MDFLTTIFEGGEMTKRRVMTYTWEKVGDERIQVEDGEGIFAQVEMPDGRVWNMPLHRIRFLDVVRKEDRTEEAHGDPDNDI